MSENPQIHMTVRNQTAKTGMVVEGGGNRVAERLETPREIRLAGDALGSARFDGSEDTTIYTTIERLSNEELEELLQ